VRDDARIDDVSRNFLASAYQLKAIADYETGPGSEVSSERAAQAIGNAKQLVAKIADILEGA
jgi:uncharacterized protein (UPF0332 family)